MDDQVQAPHKAQHNIYVYIVVLVVVIFLIVGATLFKEFKAPTQSGTSQPAPTTALSRGNMTLAATNGLTSTTLGNTVTLEVRGASDNEDIVGFDTLVSYDVSKVQFVSVATSVPGFRAYAKDNTGFVSVTSLKNPSATGATVFSQTPILTLTFSTKAKGTAHFELLSTRGRETTKMMNAANVPLIPTVSGFTIEIK